MDDVAKIEIPGRFVSVFFQVLGEASVLAGHDGSPYDHPMLKQILQTIEKRIKTIPDEN